MGRGRVGGRGKEKKCGSLAMKRNVLLLFFMEGGKSLYSPRDPHLQATLLLFLLFISLTFLHKRREGSITGTASQRRKVTPPATLTSPPPPVSSLLAFPCDGNFKFRSQEPSLSYNEGDYDLLHICVVPLVLCL